MIHSHDMSSSQCADGAVVIVLMESGQRFWECDHVCYLLLCAARLQL